MIDWAMMSFGIPFWAWVFGGVLAFGLKMYEVILRGIETKKAKY